MTPADIARADQADAREREFERRVQRAGYAAFAVTLALGAYSWLGLHGLTPVPPWSPVADVTVELEDPPPPTFDIPEGYEPAVPVEPPKQSV